MQEKSIVLHLGCSKTGTSSIQAFLRLNSKRLLEHGVFIPPSNLQPEGTVTGEHVWFCQDLVNKPLAKATEELEDGVEWAFTSSGADRLILSAENLSNFHNWSQLFSPISEKYTIEAIIYVRRQDEYLVSAWQQWNAKVSDDFWAWLLQCVGKTADWQQIINEWAKVIDTELLTVKPYERKSLHNQDVVQDFAMTARLPLDQLELNSNETNVSLSSVVVDFVEKNNSLFDDAHDNGFYTFIERMGGVSAQKVPKESTLTLKQRKAILSHYTDSNQWVYQNYCKDKFDRDMLFTPPKGVDFVTLSQDQIDEKRWSLVMELLYNLYRSK